MKNKETYTDILELIGNTPLIKLNKISKKLKGTYRIRYIDDVVVKGKTEPVGVHEVLLVLLCLPQLSVPL